MITFGYKSKFSSILRALSAIGIGLVMVISNNATVSVVRIIAALLFAAGVVSAVYAYTNRKSGALALMGTNAAVDMILGLLLFFFPGQVAGFIVYLIGMALVLFGVLQIIVIASTMSLIGMGLFSLILCGFAVIGGILLIFNPFSMSVMSIIAGVALICYGVSELRSAWTVEKARQAYEIRYGEASRPDDAPRSEGGRTDLDYVKDVDYEKIDVQ